MATLDTPPAHPVVAGHPLLNRPLALGPQVQMILIELAKQDPRVELQARLQLTMLKPGRLHTLRPYGGPAAVMSKVGRHPPRRLRGLNARVEFHGLDAAPPTIYERSA